MRSYETTFIVNPQSDDSSIDRQVNAIVEIIKTAGGEIIRENRMGTRRMAYQIAGLSQGYYTSIIHNSETDVLPILDRHFKLEEPYIRFLTIQYRGPMTDFDKEVELKGFGDRKFERYNRSDKHDSRRDNNDRGNRRDKDSSDSSQKENQTDSMAKEPLKTAPIEKKSVQEETTTEPESPQVEVKKSEPKAADMIKTAEAEQKSVQKEIVPKPESPIIDETDEL